MNKRIDRASWFTYGLGKVTKNTKINMKTIKEWCEDNLADDFDIRPIKQPCRVGSRNIGTLVRIKNTADAILFQIQWSAFQ